MIERAEPAQMDVVARHASVFKLVSSRGPEIKVRCRFCRKPAVGIWMRGELRSQTVAYFIAARPDTGTDGGNQILRRGSRSALRAPQPPS